MPNESSFGKIGYEEVGMKRKVFINFYKFSVTVCFDTYEGTTVYRKDNFADDKNTYRTSIIEDVLEIKDISGNQLELGEIENINDYLDKIAEKEKYIIFMAIKDEGTTALNEEILARLRNLGLQSELQNKFRHSYLAIINHDSIIEKLGPEQLSYSDFLENEDITYEVISAGFECGDIASIKIDGQEFAINERGLNIVVYDKVNKCVIDSVCFDTYSGLTAIR